MYSFYVTVTVQLRVSFCVFLCILHTLMIKLAITIDEDILLTLVWEEVTPTCSVMLTSLWIYELFMEMN